MGLEPNEHSWPQPGGHGSIGEAPTVLAECPDYGQQIDIYTARTRPQPVGGIADGDACFRLVAG